MPVHVVQHPLVQDALLALRDVRTAPTEFRRLARRVAVLLAVEALRDLPRADDTVETPLGPASGQRLGGDIVLVPVLRAGLGMLDGFLALCPAARVGHIGLQRDEVTAVASEYYQRLPARLDRSSVVLLDPMLATGGSAVAALEVLRRAGARSLRLVSVVAAPEGVAHVEACCPGLPIYTSAVDRGLNERKFIVPGLGDFGDRLYGTE